MIELNIFNLNYNVKRKIIDRSNVDYELRSSIDGDTDSNLNDSFNFY